MGVFGSSVITGGKEFRVIHNFKTVQNVLTKTIITCWEGINMVRCLESEVIISSSYYVNQTKRLREAIKE